MLSYAFSLADGGFYTFKKIMQQIDHSEEDVLSVSDFFEEEDYVPFNEWLSASAANHIARDDEQLLAKLQRNMQSRTPAEVG